MMILSDRISEIVESQTLAMTKRSRELKATGVDVINLSIGEPDFDTPKHIIDAASKAMADGYTHYPPVSGLPELRTAISQKLKRENGFAFEAENIIVSNGAKHSLLNAVLSIVNPGDEVLIPAPYWVSYPSLIKYAGGIPVEIPSSVESDFKVSAKDLEAAITPKTKMLIFSSPCNPSGSVMSESELKEWKDVLVKHPDVFILSDEIYEKINYTDKHYSLASYPELEGRIAVINGMSKGYAMTGWRMGYLAGPKELVQACDKIQGLMTSGASSVSQMASVTALNGPQDDVEVMRKTFENRRNKFHAALSLIPNLPCNLPDGAFYLFPDVSFYLGSKTPDGKTINNADDLCLYLLDKGHVSAVSGEAFGNPNCIRFSYAASEEQLMKAAERIAIAFRNLTH
ncbi:MAG: pyridoxal phosphate-dependent aminotransferase [Bacteroidetes bacterium]|nr:pyridoxal phosphate-dependent aminotransferase [Bacteroidota bacterium]